MRALILLCILAGALAAQDVPVPKAGYGGDYWTRNEHAWTTWVVLGKHPLPARRAEGFPEDWQAPEALLSVRWDIPKWPEVARFPPGTRLTACSDEAGGNIVKDDDGSSWLRVYLDSGAKSIGFVRCNKKWLQPVR